MTTTIFHQKSNSDIDAQLMAHSLGPDIYIEISNNINEQGSRNIVLDKHTSLELVRVILFELSKIE